MFHAATASTLCATFARLHIIQDAAILYPYDVEYGTVKIVGASHRLSPDRYNNREVGL